jgi:hypothetical protein
MDIFGYTNIIYNAICNCLFRLGVRLALGRNSFVSNDDRNVYASVIKKCFVINIFSNEREKINAQHH